MTQQHKTWNESKNQEQKQNKYKYKPKNQNPNKNKKETKVNAKDIKKFLFITFFSEWRSASWSPFWHFALVPLVNIGTNAFLAYEYSELVRGWLYPSETTNGLWSGENSFFYT